MPSQDLINLIAGVGFSALGWFASVLWVAVRDLEKDLSLLREEMPRTYLPKHEARELISDLTSDRAPMHSEHTFNLPVITPADRSELMQIMRANGIWKPVFLSLMPSASSAAAEQDHMVFGKRKSSPIAHPFFENYSHEMTLESW